MLNWLDREHLVECLSQSTLQQCDREERMCGAWSRFGCPTWLLLTLELNLSSSAHFSAGTIRWPTPTLLMCSRCGASCSTDSYVAEIVLESQTAKKPPQGGTRWVANGMEPQACQSIPIRQRKLQRAHQYDWWASVDVISRFLFARLTYVFTYVDVQGSTCRSTRTT